MKFQISRGWKLTIRLSKSARETCYSRHLDAYDIPVSKVLGYLANRHSEEEYEDAMQWVLTKIKFVDPPSCYYKRTLHPNKEDLIKKVRSLDGRRYFSLLKAFHDKKREKSGQYANLLTGSVAFQSELLERMGKDLYGNVFDNDVDSPYPFCNLLLKIIFDYDCFCKGRQMEVCNDGSGFHWKSNSKLGWNAGEYIRTLGVRYCPYCNSETIYAFRLTNRRANPYASALDHFLPSSIYPFLALNLNNLVPACTRCNTSLKGQLKTDLDNYATPYRDDLYSGFRMGLMATRENIMKACKGRIKGLGVEYVKNPSDANGNVKNLMLGVFMWKDVYNEIFKQEVGDILRRVRLLTPTYRRWIVKRKLHGGCGSDMPLGVYERLLFGCSMSKSEITKYRFAKITQDFAEQYGGVALHN